MIFNGEEEGQVYTYSVKNEKEKLILDKSIEKIPKSYIFEVKKLGDKRSGFLPSELNNLFLNVESDLKDGEISKIQMCF